MCPRPNLVIWSATRQFSCRSAHTKMASVLLSKSSPTPSMEGAYIDMGHITFIKLLSPCSRHIHTHVCFLRSPAAGLEPAKHYILDTAFPPTAAMMPISWELPLLRHHTVHTIGCMPPPLKTLNYILHMISRVILYGTTTCQRSPMFHRVELFKQVLFRQ